MPDSDSVKKTGKKTARGAVVLLSGGLDSATTLAFAIDQGYECIALSFEYGQRHCAELDAARKIAASLQVRDHRVIRIDLAVFGGSALTDPSITVPVSNLSAGEHIESQEIPVTYVPARNTIFLSYALALAEVSCSEAIFIGVNAVDYSGYPDCRPEFIEAFQRMANLALKTTVQGNTIRINTPLIQLRKSDIIRLGARLGLDYSLTVSCYQADEQGRACGHCDSCRFRQQGFVEAGLPDPTHYQ